MVVDNFAEEIFDYLKSKLEIPENVIALVLYISTDEKMKMICEYYPTKKGE